MGVVKSECVHVQAYATSEEAALDLFEEKSLFPNDGACCAAPPFDIEVFHADRGREFNNAVIDEALEAFRLAKGQAAYRRGGNAAGRPAHKAG